MVLFPFSRLLTCINFVGCHATGINSLLTSVLHALLCLNLLYQAISLTWIIISGSSSSKLRSTLRIPIHHKKNVAFPELINIISSLASKASSSFLIILLITNRIRNILMLVENYQQLYHTFIRFYSMRDKLHCRRISIDSFITHLLSLKVIRNTF